MPDSKHPAIQAFEAHVFSLNVGHEMSALLHWVSFVDLLAKLEPEACQRVYEQVIGDNNVREPGFEWSAASRDYLDVERYAATIRELIYCRVVDRFLHYLYLIARCVYELDSTLIPDAKVKISTVVAAGSVEELLKRRAQLVAADLSFNAPKLLATVLKLAGVDTGVAADAQGALELAITTRNVLVHHNGIASEKLVELCPSYSVGDSVLIDDASMKSLMSLIDEMRADIDSAMQVRHGVSAAGLSAWFQRSLKDEQEPA